MKTTISILGTLVVLIAMTLGLLMVFDVINGDIFTDNLGKVIISSLIVGGATLAIVAINDANRPAKKR